jgi:hypothetical protein
LIGERRRLACRLSRLATINFLQKRSIKNAHWQAASARTRAACAPQTYNAAFR